LLDAPGHRDFIPNMISGTSQADAAILVVPATKGEFESTFSDGGQTKEHAILARSLGVSQLIVAVNKMDTVQWDQNRFTEITQQLIPFLKTTNFKEQNIRAIPLSGFTGENLLTRKELSWYNGPVLVDLIDQFNQPDRQMDKPFRMCVSDVYRAQIGGLTIAGKIEAGGVMPKDKILILPTKETAVVKAVVISSIRGKELKAEPVAIGRAGDNIELTIRDVPDDRVLTAGVMACDPEHPIPLVTCFLAQILTLNNKVPIIQGDSVLLYTQSANEQATISKLVTLIDKATGQPIGGGGGGKGSAVSKSLRLLPKNASAIVEVTTLRSVCLELYQDYRTLGRFSLRRTSYTVAVGVVTKIISSS